jgi:hypothetical protein
VITVGSVVSSNSLVINVDVEWAQTIGGGTHRGIRYDGSVTEAAIGYSPQYTMEDGFRKTINTTREQHGLPAV